MTERTSSPAARARGVLLTARRRDDELVGCEHEFRGDTFARLWVGHCDQTLASLVLGCARLFRRKGERRIPTLGRADESRRSIRRHVNAEVAGTPKLADVRVAATLFGAVLNVTYLLGVEREGSIRAVDFQAQRRVRVARAKLQAIFYGGDGVDFLDRRAHRLFVRTELYRGPQREADALAAGEQMVAGVRGVLRVQHEDALLKHRLSELVAPHGQAVFEPELFETFRAGPRGRARALKPAELPALSAGQRHGLGDVVEHVRAPYRRRERRDEQPVVAARRHTRKRPRREAAKPIRHEPLAPEHQLRVARVLFPERQPAKRFVHPFIHTLSPSLRVSSSSLGSSPPRAAS